MTRCLNFINPHHLIKVKERKKIMNDCNKIGKSLRQLFRTHDYKLHNQYIYDWESDFFCISASGYAVEVEIKISYSDFKADFKKLQKHLILCGDKKCLTPNKFYYACPKGLIPLSEIPVYAGLIEWANGYCIKTKEAPFLHKTKEELKPILLSKYYNKCLSIFSKLLDFRREFTYGLQEDKRQAFDAFINKFHEI